MRVAERFRSDNPETMRAAALGAHGIAGPPAYMRSTAIADGTLVPLLSTYPMAEAGVFAVRPSGPPPAKTRAFVRTLAARFGPEPS